MNWTYFEDKMPVYGNYYFVTTVFNGVKNVEIFWFNQVNKEFEGFFGHPLESNLRLIAWMPVEFPDIAISKSR